jgi:hypothetical protein
MHGVIGSTSLRRAARVTRAGGLIFVGTVLLMSLVTGSSAQSIDGELAIATLSARPEFVSGGDVLVRVQVPPSISLGEPRVALNDADVTSVFRHDETGHTLTGLVTGLVVGRNTVSVAVGRLGEAGATQLSIVNHPTIGPVVSGPHEQPFVCQTESFELQSGQTLGTPVDADCSIERRVDYYYRSTAGGALKPLPSDVTPPDLANASILDGHTVPYVVRIETGTINRGIYQIAMLHDPASDPTPDPWSPSAGWNRRLIYTHGGGCVRGWYRQGTNTGGVDNDVMLRQGYAVASSSLNVSRNNCSDLLASETTMMVKEHFIEAYGEPRFTIGWGCSGGSYPQLQTADNYPGVLDGLVPCRTFPDMTFATVMTITDARLLNTYFASSAAVPFTDEQKRGVGGFLSLATMLEIDRDGAGRVHVSEFCPDVLAVHLRYDPLTNPTGTRCDVYDHAGNAFGRDPKTGFALRPLDNVGVQYGLLALNAGQISTAQFLDLNERIGGFDGDGNVVSARAVADRTAVRAAYRTGRVLNGGGGLASVPVIDYRNYLDDAPDGDVHIRFHSFSVRERLMNANGTADNYVILVEDNRHRGNTSSPVYRDVLSQMDRWLTALGKDASGDPPIVRMRRAKPADLVDACWTRDAEPKKVAETPTRATSGRCEQMYPSASFPREVAGGSIANDIVKCQLKPVARGDYAVTLTGEELVRLKSAFPDGVCDWSKPGVEQQGLGGTWLKIGANEL